MRGYLLNLLAALLSVVWLISVMGSCTGLRKEDRAVTSESCSYFVKDSTTVSLNTSHPISGAFAGRIKFWLPEPACVTLTVYNVLGEDVHTLVDEEFQAGCHSTEWDCRDDSGVLMATGVYFCQLKTEDDSETKKILLLR